MSGSHYRTDGQLEGFAALSWIHDTTNIIIYIYIRNTYLNICIDWHELNVRPVTQCAMLICTTIPWLRIKCGKTHNVPLHCKQYICPQLDSKSSES